jgi:hypothetical protein
MQTSPEAPTAAAPSSAPSVTVDPAASEEPTAAPVELAPPLVRELESEPEPSPSGKKAGPPPIASAPKPNDELAEEAALLHRAQSAWRAGQSAQALELANQHATRFPRSQLANERDVLRVLSLCKLGRAEAAKKVGARLLKKAKGSPWYKSVAESCAAQ